MQIKSLICVLAVILLTACATKPTIQYVPKEVKVEVPVKCKRPQIDKPEYTFNTAQKGDLLFNNLAKLAAENDNQNAYIIKLEAALNTCSE